MSTSRPFAYNTGSTISGTEQFGNLAVGVPTLSFEATGLKWWNGPDEELGYVIAHESPTGQPGADGDTAYLGFWRTNSINTTEFVSLSNFVANKNGTPQNFTNGNDAKTWLESNGYWTSWSTITPTPTNTQTPTITPSSNIVTSNLVLDYNFEDVDCYPGVGTTVFDLSTPQYNGTLFNSPTHSYGSGGYFDFDGVNQYIGIAHNSALKPTSAITMEQWLWADDWNAGVWPSAYLTPLSNTQGGGYAHYLGSGIFVSYVRSGGVYQTVSGTTTSLSGWHNFTTTFDGRFTKLYINGVLEDTLDMGTSGNPIQYAFNNSLLIGAEAGSSTTPQGFYWDGKISITRIYNSALSDSQVLQNYNFSAPQFVLLTPTPTFTPTPTITPTISLTPSSTPAAFVVTGGTGTLVPFTTYQLFDAYSSRSGVTSTDAFNTNNGCWQLYYAHQQITIGGNSDSIGLNPYQSGTNNWTWYIAISTTTNTIGNWSSILTLASEVSGSYTAGQMKFSQIIPDRVIAANTYFLVANNGGPFYRTIKQLANNRTATVGGNPYVTAINQVCLGNWPSGGQVDIPTQFGGSGGGFTKYEGYSHVHSVMFS